MDKDLFDQLVQSLQEAIHIKQSQRETDTVINVPKELSLQSTTCKQPHTNTKSGDIKSCDFESN